MAAGAFINLLHLRRSRHWPQNRARACQLATLRTLLAHAKRRVPMYRRLYSDVNLDYIRNLDDLAHLPIVTKADVKANFPDRTLAEGVDLSSLYPVATSGTSDRVMAYHDEHKRDWDRAADWLLTIVGDNFRPGSRRMNIPPDACYERCGLDEHGRSRSLWSQFLDLLRAKGTMRKRAARRVVARALQDYWWRVRVLESPGVDGTGVSQTRLEEYTDAIRAWRPHVIHALPMYFYVLASRASPVASGVSVRILRPSGGKATPLMVKRIEAGFGGVYRENYGTAELGTIAFDCSRSRKQHLLTELFIVEFVRKGRAVAPGEIGELVITDLRNRVAPLIRYAVGDVGSYDTTPCECGRQGQRFTVHGRLDETVVTPLGRPIPCDAIVDLFLRLPCVAFAKVFQQAVDRFLIEIVPAPTDTSLPTNEWSSKYLTSFLQYPVQVRVRAVNRVAPEVSGKYRLVDSVTHDRFHT